MAKYFEKEVLNFKFRFFIFISLFFLILNFYVYAQEDYEISPEKVVKRIKLGDFLELIQYEMELWVFALNKEPHFLQYFVQKFYSWNGGGSGFNAQAKTVCR